MLIVQLRREGHDDPRRLPPKNWITHWLGPLSLSCLLFVHTQTHDDNIVPHFLAGCRIWQKENGKCFGKIAEPTTAIRHSTDIRQTTINLAQHHQRRAVPEQSDDKRIQRPRVGGHDVEKDSAGRGHFLMLVTSCGLAEPGSIDDYLPAHHAILLRTVCAKTRPDSTGHEQNTL